MEFLVFRQNHMALFAERFSAQQRFGIIAFETVAVVVAAGFEPALHFGADSRPFVSAAPTAFLKKTGNPLDALSARPVNEHSSAHLACCHDCLLGFQQDQNNLR